MPRDYTKYEFNGEVYAKNRLVLAVVKEFVFRNKPSLAQLEEAFPSDVQGRKGLFCSEQDFNEKLKKSEDVKTRFFNKEEEKITVEGQKILVSNQWGEGNLPKFLERSRTIGFDIKVAPNVITQDDVVKEFLNNSAFKQNYQNWSEETLNAFCSLMLLANEMMLDIFITKMSSGGAIRIGRKGQEHQIAKEVFATLEPCTDKVNFVQRFNQKEGKLKLSLSTDLIEKLKQSDELSMFNTLHPIERNAFWPSDYLSDGNMESSTKLWKVSHYLTQESKSKSAIEPDALNWLTENCYIAVHKEDGNGGANNFKNISVGDVVSLGHAKAVFRIVRVSSEIETSEESPLGPDWLLRKYEVIKTLENPKQYEGLNARWSPLFPNACWDIRNDGNRQEYKPFEDAILKPYFGLQLEDLGIYVDDMENSVKDLKQTTVNTPLNQILYGPPGTGKTYHTIEAAVKAIEPEAIWESRKELKNKYDQLVKEKCIRFVTFHQSYGYEEFVEGLTAKTTEEGNVTYQIKNGIFKSICEDAQAARLEFNQAINPDGQVWKISIEGTYQNNAKTYCLENELAAIGWPDTGSLLSEPQNDYYKSLGRNDRNSLMNLAKEMSEGDLILCIDSRSSVEAVGVIGSDYLHNEQGIPTRPDYCHQRKVKWLAKGFSVDFKDLNDGKLFNLPTCYPLSRMSVKQVLNHLAENGVEVGETTQANSAQNYVLVIDEINRGNISKIFGELITLIEPSKRKGQDEAISLTLPSSGQPFSVPDNVYIIGTMNTADRSLAMMDTALRRRFDFVEMMPNYNELNEKVINYKEASIDLSKLLQVMNKRIEVLYDREHTLGHAFLMPVVKLVEKDAHEQAFVALINVFKNKIVPLLEEYFFEDWNKIRLVLGDNTKTDDSGLQFVSKIEQSYDEIFGSNHGLSSYEDKAVNFQIKAFDGEGSPWQNPRAYQQIYANSHSGNQ